jgi:DNA polymerase III epsilon subunit-like protein
MKTYNTLMHLNGNLLAAVDYETTGGEAGYHEIIQVAVVPLDSELNPRRDIRPFYHTIAPKHISRAEHEATSVHGLDLVDLKLNALSSEKVADLLVDWFEAIDLPQSKRLTPLAHNWAFESAFGKAWLGYELFNHIFHFHPRDGMIVALGIKDRASFAGEPDPFGYVGLAPLCKKFGIVNEKPHDALCDAIAEAKVYRALLRHELF